MSMSTRVKSPEPIIINKTSQWCVLMILAMVGMGAEGGPETVSGNFCASYSNLLDEFPSHRDSRKQVG